MEVLPSPLMPGNMRGVSVLRDRPFPVFALPVDAAVCGKTVAIVKRVFCADPVCQAEEVTLSPARERDQP